MQGGKHIPALYEVDFELNEGEILGIIGPSGAGKSTLMKCLYRTNLPSGGEINYLSPTWGRIELGKAPEQLIISLRRTEITYCAQFLEVIPRVTAIDVVASAKISAYKDWAMAREEAKALLETLRLSPELLDAYPATFSGGEKQRVNIARAIIAQPRLLLVDEPTASLDKESKDRVIERIMTLKSQGTAVICISHDPYTLENLADRYLRLENGIGKPVSNN